MQANFMREDVMHRWILLLAMVATALWSAPALAQSRAQLGPLCTSEGTPVDAQIDACNKIIALKVFSGENWRQSISGARSAGTRRATTPM